MLCLKANYLICLSSQESLFYLRAYLKIDCLLLNRLLVTNLLRFINHKLMLPLKDSYQEISQV